MIVGTCRYVNPDISHIYLAEWKNTIIPIYSYKNLISGYEWVDQWYQIKLNTARASFYQEMITNTPNGIYFNTKITITIPKTDNQNWKHLEDLLKCKKFIIIFKDGNERYFTSGYRRGLVIDDYILSENQYTIIFNELGNNLPTEIEESYVYNNIILTPSPSPSVTPTPSATPSRSITPSATVTPSISTSITPTCARPDGLSNLPLYYSETTLGDFTDSLNSVCNAFSYWYSIGITSDTGFISLEAQTLRDPNFIYWIEPQIGQSIYTGYNGVNCEKVPEGYYLYWYVYMDKEFNLYYYLDIMHIDSNGIIDQYKTSTCPTPSISVTPSVTSTPNISVTPFLTPTINPTLTPSISITSSVTPTISLTPTITITPTITPSI